jgi:hypothetical protein
MAVISVIDIAFTPRLSVSA